VLKKISIFHVFVNNSSCSEIFHPSNTNYTTIIIIEVFPVGHSRKE